MNDKTAHEFVPASHIEAGDHVFDADGKRLKVSEVGVGFFKRSTLITTGKTWHCLHNSDLIEREVRA